MDPSGEQWTGDELDRWFTDDFGGMDGMERLFDCELAAASPLESRLIIYGVREHDGGTFDNDDLRDFRSIWSQASLGESDPGAVWASLSAETKARLRNGWERRNANIEAWAADRADDEAAERWADEESIIPELVGDTLRGDSPVSSPPPPATGGGWWTSVWFLAAVPAVVVLVVLGLVLGSSGDDESTTSATTTSGPDESSAPPTSDSVPTESGSGELMSVGFLVDGGRGSYIGGPDLPAGETATILIDFTDDDGNPLVGRTYSITIGDPPDSADAVHADAITDETGRASFTIDLPSGQEQSVLYCFDGIDVIRITPILFH